jgi:hypothetical protein
MNFADAAKTRYPFRRAGWKHWIIYNNDTVSYQWDHGGSVIHDMRPEWFDVDDWEVEWPEKTITNGSYWKAVAEAMKENSNLFMGHPGHFDIQKFLNELAIKLGLL